MANSPNVAVYDHAGNRHVMTWINAQDCVTHDGFTWAPGNPNARPPKVKTTKTANLVVAGESAAAENPDAEDEAGETGEDEGDDDSESDRSDDDSSVADTASVVSGIWSGLTKEQAIAKAEELQVTVDKRWNRQRIINAIENAQKG